MKTLSWVGFEFMHRPLNTFTVDLEEWFHGIELDESRWPTESRLAIGVDKLLCLLDEHGTKATLFVLGAVAERHPNLVGKLHNEGHEIACHGFAHQFVYRQSPEEFRDDIRRAVDAVGSAVGSAPRGYRAPYFSIVRESTWAWEILADEGFRYDSSVFPVRNDRYGMPGAPRHPYELQTKKGPLTEVPITPLRILGMNIPFSGGAYLRILPWWAQSLAWRISNGRAESIVSYIHPWELDPDHPRIPLRPRVALTHYARLGVTEHRLRRLLGTYRFGRVDALL